jgi:beta-glucanase (GH16 family)
MIETSHTIPRRTRARRSLSAPGLLGALVAAVALTTAACSDMESAGAGAPNAPPSHSASRADAGSAAPPPPSPGPPPPAPDMPDASPLDAGSTEPTRPGWKLVWSDEFEGTDGTAIDSSKWNQETGNSGWTYNKERQYYTPGTANAVLKGGSLVVTATNQAANHYSCEYGTCQFTSARFNTAGKFEQKYGRFEARIQIPRGQGLWPAWWMLGNDISSGWPECGEIDIMENVGSDPSSDHGSMHGPGYSGGNPLTGAYVLPNKAALADSFHVYAVEWEESVVRFYFDDILYETRTPADVPAGKKWVYDHPFFLILNVAVGGQWPGDPDGTTQFPQTMKVDYVRVYAR